MKLLTIKYYYIIILLYNFIILYYIIFNPSLLYLYLKILSEVRFGLNVNVSCASK